MESPAAEKQKPAFWAGSLDSGAWTREHSVTYQFDFYHKFFPLILSRPIG